jgi:hypothetical protein
VQLNQGDRVIANTSKNMKEIVDTFLGVLDKNESNYFKNFLSLLPDNSAWYLISDYCLADSDKFNDVFTFSLLCNYDKHENIKDLINSLASKDLKKTRDIDSGFLNYLNSPYVYHFSIVIPRKEKLLAKMFNKFPLYQMLDWMDKVYQNSKEAKILHEEFCDEAQVRIKKVQREIQRQSCNKKLIRQILLTSALGTSIMYLLQKYSSPQKIAWISDRDAIIDKFDGFVFDNMFFWYQIAVSDNTFEKVNTEIVFVEPEKVGVNYFDELIRIPDYVAGALASYDIENMGNMLEIKDKYKLMFMDVFSEPMNQATLKLESTEKTALSVYNFKWMNNKST